MFLSHNVVQARSLYRSLLRETRKLPYDYLRQFFQIKFRDEFEANPHSTSQRVQLRKAKIKRLNQELGKLQAANNGDHRSLNHVLDVAYGRKGRLRHELMEPFIAIPKSEMPPPMIQGVEKSRPPVYSEAFRALLAHHVSRKTRPLPLERIAKPVRLPNRADPNSEDARLLGPLSKRRHVNILWRAYTHEIKFTIPPLDVELSQQSLSNGDNPQNTPSSPSANTSDSKLPGVTLGGFHGTGIMERLCSIAGGGGQNVAMTRRERRSLSGSEAPDTSLCPPLLPTRRLRRSHRWLLGKIPLVHYNVQSVDSEKKRKGPSKYTVRPADEALRNSRYKSHGEISPVDHAWIVYGEGSRRERRSQLAEEREAPQRIDEPSER